MSLQIVLIIVLLCCSAVFSCSETALFSLSRSEIERFRLSKGKSRVAEALLSPRRLLVSILLGNELVNVAIAILIATIIYGLLIEFSWQMRLLISVAVSTPLIIVLGEVIPKNIGVRFASTLAPYCALFIGAFAYITSPLVKLLLILANRFILLFGGDPQNIRSMIMEEEFRQMVELGCEEGTLGEAEGELIHRVFEIGDKTVEDIMTPEEAIFSLSLDTKVKDALSQIRATQFSRIPIFESTNSDIVGILHTRDLFSVMRQRRIDKIRDMEEVVRPAYFAPRTAKIEEIMREFQRLKMHMAVIVNEVHKPIGVVTMDDIFAALFQD